MVKAYATNRLVRHAAYPRIMEKYNEILKRDGKVNSKKFYEEVISKEIPSYTMSGWYQFIRRFKEDVGLSMPETVTRVDAQLTPAGDVAAEKVATTMLTNSEATQKAIAMALNISVDALNNLTSNPNALSEKEKVELFLKVMKAQDSRVKAVGMIRADNREQERFERAAGSAAFD